MIISHKYKFIFIKTAKTAGTSIEVFLSGFCGENDILTPIFPHVEPHQARNYQALEFRNHMSGGEIQDKIEAEVWCNYYKFCVERSPWDKVLSHYHMQKYRDKDQLTLETYFQNGAFPKNYGMYTDTSGNLLVDRIVRYESLNADLAEVFGRLGVPFDGQLNSRAKAEYRDDRRHPLEVLTREQQKIIGTVFAQEIALLGYSI